MGSAYYNDNDPKVCQELESLIKRGRIPFGHVDSRSIKEIEPGDFEDATVAHFFAGIGGFALAGLISRFGRFADAHGFRWISGSCPCQPFSTAGRGAGFNDPRHLWPEFYRLISGAKNFDFVVGEQVGNASGRTWLATVSDDLAASSYQVAYADLPAASIGAPHKRSRLWFIGESERLQRYRLANSYSGPGLSDKPRIWPESIGSGQDDRVADPSGKPRRADAGGMAGTGSQVEGEEVQRQRGGNASGRGGGTSSMADPIGKGSQGRLQGGQDTQRQSVNRYAGRNCPVDGLADPSNIGHKRGGAARGRGHGFENGGDDVSMADPERRRLLDSATYNREHASARQSEWDSAVNVGQPSQGREIEAGGALDHSTRARTEFSGLQAITEPDWPHDGLLGPTNTHAGGFTKSDLEEARACWDSGAKNWESGQLQLCADGKYRIVEPSIRPLAHGVSNRSFKLKALGNSIVPQVAAMVLLAYMETFFDEH